MDRARDLERTRSRIVKAALTEFAANGLAGTRCDAIARRARVNKRMLFYCFGSKKNLYREILRRKFSQRAEFFETVPDDLRDAILHWYDAFARDLELVRLLEWEALGRGREALVGAAERRDYLKRTVNRLRQAQMQGLIPAELDLVQLQISIIALTAFPLAFPQMTRLASGLLPTDPRFRRKRTQFLRWLGERLSSGVVQPAAGTKRTPASTVQCSATERHSARPLSRPMASI